MLPKSQLHNDFLRATNIFKYYFGFTKDLVVRENREDTLEYLVQKSAKYECAQSKFFKKIEIF